MAAAVPEGFSRVGPPAGPPPIRATREIPEIAESAFQAVEWVNIDHTALFGRVIALNGAKGVGGVGVGYHIAGKIGSLAFLAAAVGVVAFIIFRNTSLGSLLNSGLVNNILYASGASGTVGGVLWILSLSKTNSSREGYEIKMKFIEAHPEPFVKIDSYLNKTELTDSEVRFVWDTFKSVERLAKEYEGISVASLKREITNRLQNKKIVPLANRIVRQSRLSRGSAATAAAAAFESVSSSRGARISSSRYTNTESLIQVSIPSLLGRTIAPIGSKGLSGGVSGTGAKLTLALVALGITGIVLSQYFSQISHVGSDWFIGSGAAVVGLSLINLIHVSTNKQNQEKLKQAFIKDKEVEGRLWKLQLILSNERTEDMRVEAKYLIVELENIAKKYGGIDLTSLKRASYAVLEGEEEPALAHPKIEYPREVRSLVGAIGERGAFEVRYQAYKRLSELVNQNPRLLGIPQVQRAISAYVKELLEPFSSIDSQKGKGRVKAALERYFLLKKLISPSIEIQSAIANFERTSQRLLGDITETDLRTIKIETLGSAKWRESLRRLEIFFETPSSELARIEEIGGEYREIRNKLQRPLIEIVDNIRSGKKGEYSSVLREVLSPRELRSICENPLRAASPKELYQHAKSRVEALLNTKMEYTKKIFLGLVILKLDEMISSNNIS